MQEELRDYIENYRYRTDPRAIFTTRTGRFNYNKLRGLIKYIGARQGARNFTPTVSDTTMQRACGKPGLI